MAPLVYFARHGQTYWNAEYRLQGQAEADLTPLGREQATANGRTLAGLISNPESWEYVSSPLRRTRNSMELIRTAMGLDPEGYRTDDRLLEVNFGDWQGHTFAELEELSPGTTARRFVEKWDFLPPGEHAESYETMLARFRPFYDQLRTNTVCVCHGGIVRALFRLVMHLPKQEAAMIDVPQDRILKLENGRLDWL